MDNIVEALASLGASSVDALWVPLALWTVLALVVEGALRLGRAHADVGLPIRGAVLASLPLSVVVPGVLRRAIPDAAAAAAALPLAPAAWLPEIVIGSAVPVTAVTSGPPAIDLLLGLLVAVGGAVSVTSLARCGVGAVHLRRVRRGLGPVRADVQRRLDAVCLRLGVERPVAAAAAPAGQTPFTLGWRRPVVAVPPDLDGDALDVALTHEAAHVRRSDFAWHAAQRVVGAAFAAHPLVAVLGRALDLDRERAADAAVLDACPGQRRTYVDLLLSYATLPPPPLALGAAPGSSVLTLRISAMTQPLHARRRRQLATWGRLAGLITLVLAAGLAATTAPPAPQAPDGSAAASDSTIAAIERIDVTGGRDGASPAIDIYLKPGYGRTAAEAVSESIEETSGRPEGERFRVTVHFDGGTVERWVRTTASATRGLGASPSPTAEGRSSVDLIERVDIRRDVSGGLLEIRLREGATADDAERILTERALPPGLERVRVILPSGQAVEREIQTGVAPRDTTDEVYDQPGEWPELIGGLEGLAERLVYPPAAREVGAEGRAVLQFVVGTDGQVENLEILRSTGNAALDAAAMEAVQASQFRPGTVEDEPVRVRFALPVTFRLPSGG